MKIFFFLVAHGRFCETCKFFVQVFVCIWNAMPFVNPSFTPVCFKDQAGLPTPCSLSVTLQLKKKGHCTSKTIRELPKIWLHSWTNLHIQLYCHLCIFLCLELSGFRANSFSHITSQLSVTYIMFGRLSVEEFLSFCINMFKEHSLYNGSDREVHSNIVDLFLEEKIV